MTASSFYHDGYRDWAYGRDCSPPDVAIYAAEYLQGWQDAKDDDYLPFARVKV